MGRKVPLRTVITLGLTPTLSLPLQGGRMRRRGRVRFLLMRSAHGAFALSRRELLFALRRWLRRSGLRLRWRKPGWRIDRWFERPTPTSMRQRQHHRLLHIVLTHLPASGIRRQRHGGFMNHQIAAQAIHSGCGTDVGDRPRQPFIKLHLGQASRGLSDTLGLLLFARPPRCAESPRVAFKGQTPPHHFVAQLRIAQR